jgi:hypothetical protein
MTAGSVALIVGLFRQLLSVGTLEQALPLSCPASRVVERPLAGPDPG